MKLQGLISAQSMNLATESNGYLPPPDNANNNRPTSQPICETIAKTLSKLRTWSASQTITERTNRASSAGLPTPPDAWLNSDVHAHDKKIEEVLTDSDCHTPVTRLRISNHTDYRSARSTINRVKFHADHMLQWILMLILIIVLIVTKRLTAIVIIVNLPSKVETSANITKSDGTASTGLISTLTGGSSTGIPLGQLSRKQRKQ